MAMPPEAIAEAVAYAIGQPEAVDVGEITVRPTFSPDRTAAVVVQGAARYGGRRDSGRAGGAGAVSVFYWRGQADWVDGF
jgi:hypothetical protein